MADAFYREKGVREDIELELVTPNTGIFTKPLATKVLTGAAEERRIKTTANFDLIGVNPSQNTIESASGDTIPYDLLVSTMPNMGAPYVEASGMGDGMGYVMTDHNTLKAKKHNYIYVIGDATNVPTSKAAQSPIMKPIPWLKT